MPQLKLTLQRVITLQAEHVIELSDTNYRTLKDQTRESIQVWAEYAIACFIPSDKWTNKHVEHNCTGILFSDNAAGTWAEHEMEHHTNTPAHDGPRNTKFKYVSPQMKMPVKSSKIVDPDSST